MANRMTAIRDNLCELGRLEIPRPKCQGMQFVATRGRQGFYKTIRENGAKYGIQLKPQGPKRPQLSQDLFSRPTPVPEESSEEILIEENEQPKTQYRRPPQRRYVEQEQNNNNNYKYENRPPISQPRVVPQRTGGITQAVNRSQLEVSQK